MPELYGGQQSFRLPEEVGSSFLQTDSGPVWRRNQQQRFSREAEEFQPGVDDYVVEATCKRIRRIVAEKVCDQDVLNGKICRVEVPVPPVEVMPVAVENYVRLPDLRCPEGFTLQAHAKCELVQATVEVMFAYPEAKEVIGDRCVDFSAPQ